MVEAETMLMVVVASKGMVLGKVGIGVDRMDEIGVDVKVVVGVRLAGKVEITVVAIVLELR